MHKNSGFNIIELVVVVVIIGILSSLAIPQYTKTVERSRQAEALTNLAAIRGAQLRYYLEYANYSGNFDALDIDNITVGTYFNCTPRDNITSPDVGVIGRAIRNGNKMPGICSAAYNITLYYNGTISKGCLP